MNPQTRIALGVLGILLALLVPAYNALTSGVAPSSGEWFGSGVVSGLSLVVLIEALLRIRRGASGQHINWKILATVLCGVGLGRISGNEVQLADAIFGFALIGTGIAGFVLSLRQRAPISE